MASRVRSIALAISSASLITLVAVSGPTAIAEVTAEPVTLDVRANQTEAGMRPIVKKYTIVCKNEHRDVRWSGVEVALISSASDATHIAVQFKGTIQPQTSLSGHERLVVYLTSAGTDAAKAVVVPLRSGANNQDVRETVFVDSIFPFSDIDAVAVRVDG